MRDQLRVRTLLAFATLCAGAGLVLLCCENQAFIASDAGATEAAAPQDPGENRTCARVVLSDFVPEAARFVPGSIVPLRARIATGDEQACSATLRLAVTHIGELVHEQTQRTAITPGLTQTVVLRWDAPDEDFRGYLAVLSADNGERALGTGVDVSSTPLRYPRYGYLSTFSPEQTQRASSVLVATLAERYHLNMFQFYDWFARPEDLIPRTANGEVEPTWTDLFDRTHALATIRDLVDAVHDENAFAMAYVTIYTAREGYEQRNDVSPAWGLYEQPGAETQAALAFGGERYLFLFDPSNAHWQAKMTSEYRDAIAVAGFDGVHIDQFGRRPTLYRADGTAVELNETFAPFLEVIDRALEESDPERDACVFNLVDGAIDGYAVDQVAGSAACDLLYSELWFATDTYEQVRAYVERLRRPHGGRAVVLAVYPQYGEDVGRIYEAEDARLRGAAIDRDHAGFSGTGFVDEFDTVDDAIIWTISQVEDALVSYVVRYANASGMPATRTLQVDGMTIGKLRFSARGHWDEWSFDAWLQERLAPGEHEVRLVHAADDSGAVNIDRLTLGEFDADGVLLQNAVIFASGATAIQIGDDLQGLAHEYFPNRSKTLSPSLARALRRQYSFITAHETVLFAPEVQPIEARLELIEARSGGHQLISEGEGGIWTLLRRAPSGDVIHLVNLIGVDNDRWRDAAPTPEPQEKLVLRYAIELDRTVRDVLWATPDEGTGAFEAIPFTTGDRHIEFEVPRLAFWDLVLVRYL